MSLHLFPVRGHFGAQEPSASLGSSFVVQQKLLLLVAGACAALGIFYFAYYLAVGFGSISFIVLGVVAAGTLPVGYAKATGRVRAALNVQSTALFVLISGAAFFQNGVDSPALRWLVVPPCVALIAGSEWLALSFVALFVTEVGVLAWHGPGSWSSLSLLASQSARQTAMATALSTTLIALVVGNGARWSRGLQRALELAHQAATASAAAKASFVAHLSHELRTPLQGLVGATDILRTNHLDNLQREQLIAIQAQSVRTVLGMLNDVLDFSKLEANKVALQRVRLDPRALIFEINEQFAVQAFAKGLELTSSCDFLVPQTFIGDPMRVRQVVCNLVSNAVKFTGAGGVHLHVSTQEAGAHGPKDDGCDGWIEIAVSDTGIGMSESVLASLFKPFHQADETVAYHYGGTGLGLSIAKSFAELMGGRIEVDSIPGFGTTFTVVLPLRSGAALATEAPAVTMKGMVWIATRSPGLLRHLGTRLEELGVRAETSDALPAEDVVRRLRPRLVLVDSALLDGQPSAQTRLGELSVAGAQLVIVSPLTEGAAVVDVSDAIVLLKPVSRSSLEELLAGLSRVGSVSWQTPALPSSPGQRQGPVVLVAEDDPVNRVVVERMLYASGVNALMVEDGQAALDLLKRQRVAMVLMDVQMPVVDGIAATRALRQWERETGSPETPIIAMTGHHESEDLIACREAGMTSSLVKPFHLQELRLALAAHLPQWVLITESGQMSAATADNEIFSGTAAQKDTR